MILSVKILILFVSFYYQELESYIVSLRSNCWWPLLVDLFIGSCYFIFLSFFFVNIVGTPEFGSFRGGGDGGAQAGREN